MEDYFDEDFDEYWYYEDLRQSELRDSLDYLEFELENCTDEEEVEQLKKEIEWTRKEIEDDF